MRKSMKESMHSFSTKRQREIEKGVQYKKGVQYYEKDRGYDKAFYENDAMNYAKIAGAFACFYCFNIFHFWAILEFGICESEAATMY